MLTSQNEQNDDHAFTYNSYSSHTQIPYPDIPKTQCKRCGLMFLSETCITFNPCKHTVCTDCAMVTKQDGPEDSHLSCPLSSCLSESTRDRS